MKKNILVILILSVVLMGCFSSNNSNTESNTTTKGEVQTESNNNLIEEGEQNSYFGTYDSKKGVMTDISCYCYQTGYFTTEDGEEFVICFKDDMEEATCSENLKIEGYFENVTITSDENSPCSAGEREIFYVTKFECM